MILHACSVAKNKAKQKRILGGGGGTQSSAFLKLPGCVYQAAMIENYWSRGHSSFRGLRKE